MKLVRILLFRSLVSISSYVDLEDAKNYTNKIYNIDSNDYKTGVEMLLILLKNSLTYLDYDFIDIFAVAIVDTSLRAFRPFTPLRGLPQGLS